MVDPHSARGWSPTGGGSAIAAVFPHQLFADFGWIRPAQRVLLIEDSLFFGDARYPATFHKQKLWLHRATMRRYEGVLKKSGVDVVYVEYSPNDTLTQQLSSAVGTGDASHVSQLCTLDPVDFILESRIRAAAAKLGWELTVLPNPGFLNTREDNTSFRAGKTRWFNADFYKHQRQRLGVLLDDKGGPVGGQWSFDADNRKKIPPNVLKTEVPPLATVRKRDRFDTEAVEYVNRRFPSNPGSLATLFYPTSHADAAAWLGTFLEVKLRRFGDYEDAIEEGQSWLWHSVLTPSLNIGLLTPQQVLSATLLFVEKERQRAAALVPLNSVEGFVRQLIGWREFMRATYDDLGVRMRTSNHWGHTRKLPPCFYTATTGIVPVDDAIHRILATGYCHHIERLVVLGGFLFLCEIDPNDVYRWFMEMFVDSYDWVMVTNVYAMSQNADGGLITTKPYFTGSAYIRKMSHYQAGAAWCDVWDGLYWRWVWNHKDALASNPRWAMMCAAVKKMDPSKRESHCAKAEEFLAGLDVHSK